MAEQVSDILGGKNHFPILGLDISETKIGLAIVEGVNSSPQPLYTYRRTTRARDLAQCAEWVQRYGIASVVVGLPLNMDGTPGPRAQWIRRYCRDLQERIIATVLLQDERLTTVEAEELLRAREYNYRERAERIDAVAATLILERFLQENELGGFDG